ncbi:MAG: Gfo/Idh/MocA family protein [Desertimonas sp.]
MTVQRNSSRRANRTLRWGVLGARSRIYRQRLRPAFDLAGQRIIAEGSRRDGEASYADVIGNPLVDAVYIPLPNDVHADWVIRALEVGKHVLCEKPLTLSAARTAELYEAARLHGRHLSEAFMWPHHPRAQRLVGLVAGGELGRLVAHHAVFQYDIGKADDHRLDERGGGVLFDVGIYCLGPALLMAPAAHRGRAVATATRNEAGVDTATAGWVELGPGFAASFVTCGEAPARRYQEIVGTDGAIQIDNHVPGPERAGAITVTRRDGSRDQIDHGGANAYERMVSAFVAEVGEGQAPWWPASQSIRLAHLLDTLHQATRTPGA